MRRQFEMTEAQLDKLLTACTPAPYLIFGGMAPKSPQERANAAWAALGRELGFDGATALPVHGMGERFFTAEAIGSADSGVLDGTNRTTSGAIGQP